MIAKNAAFMKPYLGQLAYTLSSFKELARMELAHFDIEFDDGQNKIKGEQSQLYFHIYNGKYGGGGMMLNPLGLVNDGFLEVVYTDCAVGALRAMVMFSLPGGRMYNSSWGLFNIFKAR